jgi:hypothetical protein
MNDRIVGPFDSPKIARYRTDTRSSFLNTVSINYSLSDSVSTANGSSGILRLSRQARKNVLKNREWIPADSHFAKKG